MTTRFKMMLVLGLLYELHKPCSLRKRTVFIDLAIQVLIDLLQSEQKTSDDQAIEPIPF